MAGWSWTWKCFVKERREASVFAAEEDEESPHSRRGKAGCASKLENLPSEASNLSSLPSISVTQDDSLHGGGQAERKLENNFIVSCFALRSQNNVSFVSCLAVSGELLFCARTSPSSALDDGGVTVWKISSVSPLDVQKLGEFGKGAVKSIVVRSNLIFTAHQDRRIRVWRMSENSAFEVTKVATLPRVRDQLRNIFVAPSANMGRYADTNRRRRKEGRELTWLEHADVVSCVAMTQPASTEELLYSASWDRSVKVWRVRDFACMESFRAHEDAVNAIVAMTGPKGSSYVLTASADSTIKLWKRHEKQRRHVLVQTLKRHRLAVNALALTEDGTLLYSGGSGDKCVVVWRWENYALLQNADGNTDNTPATLRIRECGALRGHRGAILCLATVGNETLCSGSADKCIRIWRRDCGSCSSSSRNDMFVHTCVAVLQGHTAPVKSICVSEIGDSSEETSFVVYSGGLDRQLRVWLPSNSKTSL